VDFVGVTSRGETNYKTILNSPDALQNFELLFARGNPAAKCYALFGIRKLDPAKYKELAAPLRRSNIEVPTMRGCIQDKERLRDIIKRIDKGEF
jgi:arginase family enzyme